MQFKSDDQRKAVFARIKGKGGGGGTSGTTAHTTKKTKKPKKPPATKPRKQDSTYIGTGGAIYNAPSSNWFQAAADTPSPNWNYGSVQGNGVGPYIAPVFEQFHPAETFWGNLYDIVHGVDPETGDILPPYGTPGTVKFGAGTPYTALQDEWAGHSANEHPTNYFGGTGHLSSGFWGQAPGATDPRPWWAK